MTTETAADRILDGHEHDWSFAGRCIRCGASYDDVAALIEPAQIIDVDPVNLLGWEDDQDGEHVRELADAMRRGEAVPAIMVGASGLVLYDGHHRVAAARMAGVKTLKAVAIPSSWRNAGIGSKLGNMRLFATRTTSGIKIG